MKDEQFKDYLKKNGLRMTKQLSGAGLFSSSVWDNRTVYTIADLDKLNKEGFSPDQDVGVWVFNMICTNIKFSSHAQEE